MNRLGSDESARDLESRAERIIEADIWCNDSSLVSSLLTVEFQDEFTIEMILNLFDGSLSAMIEFLLEEGFELTQLDALSESELRELAEENQFSPLLQDVLEWWRISDHLCRHLIRIGEPVLQNAYGSWWGRTCSGQAIILDGTIQRLLTGERHED